MTLTRLPGMRPLDALLAEHEATIAEVERMAGANEVDVADSRECLSAARAELSSLRAERKLRDLVIESACRADELRLLNAKIDERATHLVRTSLQDAKIARSCKERADELSGVIAMTTRRARQLAEESQRLARVLTGQEPAAETLETSAPAPASAPAPETSAS